MKQYLELLENIIAYGYNTGDRTGVGTRALPGYSYSMKLTMDDNGVIHNYPLLTTKKVFLRGTFEELIWKMHGETNIISLVQKNVHIWSEWPFKKWLEYTGEINKFNWYKDEQKSDYSDEWKKRLKDFEDMIVNDSKMRQWGELGPTYGHHMRNFGEVRDPSSKKPGVDQLQNVVNAIATLPMFLSVFCKPRRLFTLERLSKKLRFIFGCSIQ